MLTKSILARALFEVHEEPLVEPGVTEISQEETSDEIERVYFARLSDFEQLQHASVVEHQEQWEYRLFQDDKPLGTLRSRAIDHGESYELTIKTYLKDGPGSRESNLASTQDIHEVIAELADRVLRKQRYVFPVQVRHNDEDVELKWEIDVFILEDESFEPWVKIDFEVPNASIAAPPLPIQVEEIIETSFGRQLSDEERATIDGIFDRVKSTK